LAGARCWGSWLVALWANSGKGVSGVIAMNQAPRVEERFWTRYSLNHEFPLSSASSITIHVLAIAFMVITGWLLAKFALGSNKALDLDTIVIAGGGGKPGHVPENDGASQEAVEKATDVRHDLEAPTPVLQNPSIDPLDRILNEKDSRPLEQANEAIKRLASLTKETRQKLVEPLTPWHGKTGPGRDGGADRGNDKDVGPNNGPGINNAGPRPKRLLRWVMKFNTLNGNDYRKQLAALGAILAFPQPDGSYRVYRNLNQRPLEGKIEDLNTLNRIFWVDDKPESIASLSQAMGLKPPDGPIIAFFPVDLETKLLRLELAYRGLKEDEIKLTEFRIVAKGGTYEPVVVKQE
jgi:hypothetical protein